MRGKRESGGDAVKKQEPGKSDGEYWHETKTLAGRPGMPPSPSLFWVVGWHDESWVRRVEGQYVVWLESSLPEKTQESLRREREKKERNPEA